MKLHRFIGDYPIKHGTIKIKDAELAGQVRDVLRMQTGEQMIIGDGKGNEALAELLEYGKDELKLSVVRVSKNANEPETPVILYCAILKRENFEIAAQKATEAGVVEIVPVLSRRTVKLDVRADRLKKIIKEAAEQSGRGVLPKLHTPLDLASALEHAKSHNDVALFFHPDAQQFDRHSLFRKKIGVFIGPEGGWEDDEVKEAKAAGLTAVSIGKLTLRAETAATIAVYLAASVAH